MQYMNIIQKFVVGETEGKLLHMILFYSILLNVYIIKLTIMCLPKTGIQLINNLNVIFEINVSSSLFYYT